MTGFETVRPEAVGIAPDWIHRFVTRCEAIGLNLHSFLLLRHGCVAAEGYWKPWKPGDLHRLYSATKSFVSIAIGLCADRGLLSLEDKITRFFPDITKGLTIHPYVAKTTVRDLLRMATPYSCPTYDDPEIAGPEWLRSYFTAVPDHPAGTVFYYDSCASYVLGAIVKRVTGLPFLEYLKREVLDEIGFHKASRCLSGPDGEAWAGSAILTDMESFARFALLLQQKGRWNGRQLISEEYVTAATSRQIPNRVDGGDTRFLCGYGYQFWIVPEGGFCCRGLGNQVALCLPEKELIFVCNGDSQACEGGGWALLMDVLWTELIDKIGTPVEKNDRDFAALQAHLAGLSIPAIAGAASTPLLPEVNGVCYGLDENPMGITELTLFIRGDEGTLTWRNGRGEKQLPFGIGKNLPGVFPETHFPGDRLGQPANRMYRCLSSGAWLDGSTFQLRCHILDDYLGRLTVTLGFRGNTVGLTMRKTAQFFLKDYQGFAGGRKIP